MSSNSCERSESSRDTYEELVPHKRSGFSRSISALPETLITKRIPDANIRSKASYIYNTRETEQTVGRQNSITEAVDHQRSYTLVRTSLEWVLMETINWLAESVGQFSRGRLKWSSYRKLRRCKSRENVVVSNNSNSNSDNRNKVLSYDEQVSPIRTEIEASEFEGAQNNQCRSGRVERRDYFHLNCRDNSHQMNLNYNSPSPEQSLRPRRTCSGKHYGTNSSMFSRLCIAVLLLCFINEFSSSSIADLQFGHRSLVSPSMLADASLIIGDSAIEIQEVGDPPSNAETPSQTPPGIGSSNGNENSVTFGRTGDQINGQQLQSAAPYVEQPNLILSSTPASQSDLVTVRPTQSPPVETATTSLTQSLKEPKESQVRRQQSVPAGPLPPIAGSGDSSLSSGSSSSNRPDETGETQSSSSSDSDGSGDIGSLSRVLSAHPKSVSEEKAIAGKVVDFELTPAGGHNKAKIKKKKKKKKKKESEEFKKWGKKKKSEKKASEKKHKESMKKKKEEGKKGKKKWGVQEKGQKKKGSFKKKKWGKKVKKGKGLKKGKKGKKFLKDKGHKNTGFKTVYHKEEWGKSSKWHDIKREKKWDEKSKKWKKKWKKEKGKKYKGDHMKKFKKEKKSGKKYKKEKKEKFKKSKKEEFKKGKKEKMEEHAKKKEGGMKKEMKAEKKKKKKKKG